MAKSINQVTLLGNLTRDPELRQTPSGQNVVSISLALNSSYKNKEGNWEEKTDYIDVVAWSKLAENVANYTHKGSKVVVQGKLQTRSWEQDGQKRNKVEVLAHEIMFMDAPSGSSQSAAPSKATNISNAKNDEPINLNDIPF